LENVSTGPVYLSGRDELRAALQHALLGHYEVLDELGSGGMATVFLAHDIALDRLVAIKVMLPALLLSEGMSERFRREARTAASLNHPHIIPVFGVGEDGPLLYFVMKYVAGRPLDGILREFGKLPIDMVEAIVAQVGSAIAYAHRKGVVHRDIKPANIMLDDEGWAVVTDFGIAKTVTSSGLTSTGASVGTPQYMSLEQFNGDHVGPLSDQYSLGVVAYQMLTGELPLKGNSVADFVRAHLGKSEITPIAGLRPDCPAHLATVVTRMLERESVNRWPTLDQALSALRPRSTSADDPVRSQMVTLAKSGPRRVNLPPTPTSPVPKGRRLTGPTSTRAPVGQPRRRRSVMATIGTAVATGGVAVAVVVSSQLWRSEQSPRPAAVLPPAPTPLAPTAASRPDSVGRITPPPVPALRPAAPRPKEVRPNAAKLAAPPAMDTVVTVSPPPPPPPPPAAPTTAWVYLGTKHEGAFVYINGVARLPPTPSLRWWEVPLGQVTVELRAEGCRPWQATHTYKVGDSVRYNYKFPVCRAPSDSSKQL
jgi:serine/threonine-protein kinase